MCLGVCSGTEKTKTHRRHNTMTHKHRKKLNKLKHKCELGLKPAMGHVSLYHTFTLQFYKSV